jgi:hypothetical protein
LHHPNQFSVVFVTILTPIPQPCRPNRKRAKYSDAPKKNQLESKTPVFSSLNCVSAALLRSRSHPSAPRHVHRRVTVTARRQKQQQQQPNAVESI